MSSNFKSVPTTHADPVRAGDLYRLAIVGAGTLKGKEIAEVLGDRNFPSSDIKLLDDNDSLGQLESVGDEVSFIQSVRSEQFDKVDFTFFASDQECTRQNWRKAQNAGSSIVDLSYALEDEPESGNQVALDPAVAGPDAHAGTSAGTRGSGSPGRRGACASVVAGSESRRCETSGGDSV